MSIFLRFVTVVFFAILFDGCATGSALVTGAPRQATEPSDVTILREIPYGLEFEHIAIVTSEAEGWTKQDGLDMALQELKEQASKVGANAIILRQIGTNTDTTPVYIHNSEGGDWVYYSSEYETLTGDAIYVFP